MLAKRKHKERIEFLIADVLYWAAVRLRWPENIKTELNNARKQLSEGVSKPGEEGAEKLAPTYNSTVKQIQLHKQRQSYEQSSQFKPAGELKVRALQYLKIEQLEVIAVTIGPGLAPALKIGLQATQKLATSWEVPVVAINHMEGHLWSSLLKNSRGNATTSQAAKLSTSNEAHPPSSLPYPALGLLVSGGHTQMLEVKEFADYRIIGRTLDDAAGEAFDKFAVMLDLGYPGGATIEQFAERALQRASVEEIREKYPLPIPMKSNQSLDLSFSGLKTAALYMLKQKAGLQNNSSTNASISLDSSGLEAFAASFQYSVVESICIKLEKAIEQYRPKVLLTGGGVIANKYLRKRIRSLAKKHSLIALLPPKQFLGDNASMIGLVGYYRAIRNVDIISPSSDYLGDKLDRQPNLSL
jgi:N6-L-threonylcarbamoyladenine synthase